jgi:hypothetical protein
MACLTEREIFLVSGLSPVLDAQQFHLEPVPHLYGLFGRVQAGPAQLADMHQSFDAGRQGYESAERQDTDHGPFEDGIFGPAVP